MTKISPSILSADFGCLAEDVKEICDGGCDYVHVDVMDGRFVPNITIGPLVVAAAKKAASKPLDVHLMIDEPERYLDDFIKAGADLLTVHAEATRHLHRTLTAIRELGARPGVTICPATPLSAIEWVLDEVDLVLVMSVNPGFGGQRFISASLERLRALRAMIADRGLDVEIEVDGGVVVENAAEVAAAGADVLVSGTGIFGQKDRAATIAAMRAAADGATTTA